MPITLTKPKALLILVSVIEIQIVMMLLLSIQSRNSKILSAISINPINKSGLIFPKDTDLHYFYELNQSGLPITKNPSWVTWNPQYRINRDGLNSLSDYATAKPSNTFRIITLGDSFTFGLYVDTAKNYSSVLEKQLNQNHSCSNYKKFEVINLGVPGYDVRYELERFKRTGSKYNPDLVIWLLKNDDFMLSTEFLSQSMRFDNAYRPQLNPQILVRFIDSQGNLKEDPEIINYETRAINAFKDYYTGKLIIQGMYLGNTVDGLIRQFVQSGNEAHYFSKIDSSIGEVAKFPDGHPNELGHRLIATGLFNYLTTKIISC